MASVFLSVFGADPASEAPSLVCGTGCEESQRLQRPDALLDQPGVRRHVSHVIIKPTTLLVVLVDLKPA